MDWERIRRNPPLRIGAAVAGVTLVVTAALIGVVALFSGETTSLNDRFPYYILITGIAFVVTLWKLDEESVDGVTVLIATTGIAIGAGILIAFAIEGLRFGLLNPSEIVASQLIVYFVAAALFCTGFGMWFLRHWREFTADFEDAEPMED